VDAFQTRDGATAYGRFDGMPHDAANGSKSRFLYRPLVVAGDRPVADRWYVPRHLRGALMSSVVSGAVALEEEMIGLITALGCRIPNT
jgi:hypothetical protein